MMTMKRTKFKDNSNKFIGVKKEAMDSALKRMAKDIVLIAMITIPFLGGDLQDSLEAKNPEPLKHRVLANKEYAAYQEKGMRKDGSHKVKNYSTPGTGKGFLRGAGAEVVKDAINYMRQANQLYRM